MNPIHVDMAARDGSLHVSQIVTYNAMHYKVVEIAHLRSGRVRVHMVPRGIDPAAFQHKILVLKTS